MAYRFADNSPSVFTEAPFYSHVPAAIREEMHTYNAQESALDDAASLITSLLAHGGLCDRIKTDLLSLQKVLWGIKPTVSACWLVFPLTLIFFPPVANISTH